MKKISAFITASALSLFAINAYADIKVGIVDANLVLQKAPLMISINSDLVKTFKPRLDEINSATKKLQEENDSLNLNGASMSQEDRSKLQDKIITDKANIDMLTASLQRDLAIEKNKEMQKFSNKLSEVINDIAKTDNYDLIEQKTNVIFVNPKYDITNQVIDKMH